MAIIHIRRQSGAPPARRSPHAPATSPSTARRGARLAIAVVLFGVLALAGANVAAATTPSPTATPSATPQPTASPAPELIFSDPEFAFELRRTMSAIYSGEADLGECLATAKRITEGDFESWYTEWKATADHFKGVADKARADRHLVTARDAYYRIATYYRTAEFFLHGDPTDPRIIATWRKSRDAFVTAAKLDTRVHFEAVWIPYDKTKLPGYFYAAKSGSTYRAEKRPLLIIQTGFDGCQEELHPYAVAAVERGYNVLSFEGPGQGQVIRVQGLPMRRDWEHVVRQIVDYAVARRDVDRKRIALWGISLGGYLAPRAAAFDHRIAACVADAGIYDIGEILLGHLKEGQDVPASMTETELHDWLLTESEGVQRRPCRRDEGEHDRALAEPAGHVRLQEAHAGADVGRLHGVLAQGRPGAEGPLPHAGDVGRDGLQRSRRRAGEPALREPHLQEVDHGVPGRVRGRLPLPARRLRPELGTEVRLAGREDASAAVASRRARAEIDAADAVAQGCRPAAAGTPAPRSVPSAQPAVHLIVVALADEDDAQHAVLHVEDDTVLPGRHA